KDVVIVGSSFKEGMTVKTHNNTKGLVRAFDVRSGKVLWTFNTIPRPGELGNDTWENESWAINGNTGVWTQITVDEDAGLVYLPVESPTSDFYGGHRPGNNLFGESLVCVDLKTGQRKWHFQFVHHPVWDHDMSSAAMLTDVNKDGKIVKAVAVPSKQGYVYAFNRITGEPLWPMVETPVPQSDVPGEKTSATQPIPMDAHGKPFAYARPCIKVPDDIIDFTPALRAEALDNLQRYRVENSAKWRGPGSAARPTRRSGPGVPAVPQLRLPRAAGVVDAAAQQARRVLRALPVVAAVDSEGPDRRVCPSSSRRTASWPRRTSI